MILTRTTRFALCLVALLVAFGWYSNWLTPAAADRLAPAAVEEATQLWKTSAHALGEVNCSSCHQDAETKSFVAKPTYESCRSCHEQSVDTFLLGKHGIRLLEGESPLKPALARLPMHAEARDLLMTCNTCHDVHSVDTVVASVDSCLTCHNDTHSQNYRDSAHAGLFEASKSLPRPSATAVSCATCHLPRYEHGQGDNAVTLVNHNNTYTLLPRDRMVGEVCANCHGVEFGYNSIFDDELVEANFDRPPTLSLQTFDLIRALEERRAGRDQKDASE
ncbi:hypothetical protein KR51_00028540 [Rubidibacter lacunae KORDI 51-2]|uniref:Uncharacterized protein n=1 Tax=Rubidibacter lacunae KORDI 51-2 TaxID=582515 RepID=U5DI40_9CHRO|nr:hypothetical protein KR51_00028540 [Rubidibacter lacunae KORDI 51-2]